MQDAFNTALANKVNIGAPQEYDIPFASIAQNQPGGRSVYWKNQLCEVGVRLFVSPVSGQEISDLSIIATLPVGFRPTSTMVMSLSVAAGVAGTYIGGALVLNPNGTIQYRGTAMTITGGHNAFGFIMFVVQ